MIPYDAARAFLTRNFDQHVPLLGALEYEPVRVIHGVEQSGEVAALALVIEPEPIPESLPTIMVSATSAATLAALLAQEGWPAPAVWSTTSAHLLPELEHALGANHDPVRGLLYYGIATITPPSHPLVRRLAMADADALDLAPCSLSPTALRSWIKRGWRAYGVVSESRLLCHALAAYTLGDTDEVSAVFTAPQARRQGFAKAVVAATVADIVGRKRRAVYACRKTNRASQRVAESVGLAPLLETWEIVR